MFPDFFPVISLKTSASCSTCTDDRIQMGPSWCVCQSNCHEILCILSSFLILVCLQYGYGAREILVRISSDFCLAVRWPFLKHGSSLAHFTLVLNLKISKSKWRHQVDKRNVSSMEKALIDWPEEYLIMQRNVNSFMLWTSEAGNPTFRTPMPLTQTLKHHWSIG